MNEVEAVGGVIAQSLAQWFGDKRNEALVERLRTVGLNFRSSLFRPKAAPGPLAGKTLVLTGTLPSLSREQATAKIEALGGRSAPAWRRPIMWWPVTRPAPNWKKPGNRVGDLE